MAVQLIQDDPRFTAMVLDRALTPRSKIPQLEDVAIYVYGHSQAQVLGTGYATTGRHWTNLLAETNAASVTNNAIGGTVMEQATLTMTYNGQPAAWPGPTNATKKLALIMDVYNTAGYCVTAAKATHLLSVKKAVETIAALVCSDQIDNTNTPTPPWTYSAGWASTSYAYAIGGSQYYTTTPGSYVIYQVPAGVTNKRYWALMAASDYRGSAATGCAPINVTRNNGAGSIDVSLGVPMHDTSDPVNGFSHRAIDCGVYSTGQYIAIAHAGASGQYMYFDGFLKENGLNHATFTEDNPDFAAPGDAVWASWNPGFDAARIAEFNQAVREQVADFNTRVPNGASTLVMQDRSVWQADMAQATFAGNDRVHINDRGNAYYFAKLTQQMSARIPWTSRLHSVVTTG